MIEMLIGAMVMAWLATKTVPTAISEFVTTMRASKAGEWSLIDKDRDRKAARAEARREAWANARGRRHRQAGGDGDYRPGLGAYLSDVYHGFWEDELEKRTARRAARPPYQPGSVADRFDSAVEAKVQRQRDRFGLFRRAGRLLIDPVGRTAPQPDRGPLPPLEDPPPVRPRTACPVCGDTLIEHGGLWLHPAESTCRTARRPDGGYHVPVRVNEQASDLYWLNVAEGRTGALGETQTARDLRGMFGDEYPQHVYDQAAADATHTQRPADMWVDTPNTIRNCVRCRTYPPQPNSARCVSCDEAMAALRRVTDAAWFQVDPDWSRGADADREVAEEVQRHDTYGWKPEEIYQMTEDVRWAAAARPTTNPNPTTDGGNTVNTATGDVHDVETCKAECEAVADDLGRIDTALDVVDEAIRHVAAAVEHIEAWLQSKNADACVPGMSSALDALSVDNLKDLMDKVAAARQGVADTIDNLAPLEEAAELVGSTDGSALNGR